MNLKKYLELRDKKRREMKQLIETAGNEERALGKDEREKFDQLEIEIRELDATIEAIQTQREIELGASAPEGDAAGKDARTAEEREYDAFEAFLRGDEETRADAVQVSANMKKGDNGAVIPSSIANKIIEKVIDICPIFHDAERYNVGGTLSIPYYDDSAGDIKMDYADEFTEGESSSGKFASISLTGHLARAITDVSKSLINNSQFDIVGFVVRKMSVSIAKFIERELLGFGTTSKIAGLSGVTKTVTAASAAAIKADELIDLQEAVPDVYQGGAYFIMNKSTRAEIRKLKDGQGNYLLNKDAQSRWGYTLFGKDVYTSANMPGIAAGKTAVYYGDMAGLAVKVSEDINIEVLRETKARQHVVEVLGFVELDAKVQNAEMVAKLVMKAS